MSPEDSAALDWDDLPALFPGMAQPDRWLPLLRRHHSLIEESSGHTRVTSVPPAEAIRRHYAESLELLRLTLELMPAPAQVVDVGSGGGYPGLVIAATLPHTRVSLVEPLQKRARLLAALAAELELANVAVLAVRAEEAGRSELRDTAALVTARAVAPLAELVEYTAPFASPGGLIALPKGSALERELADAGAAIAALNCEIAAQSPMRDSLAPAITVLCLRKLGPTPAEYPRRAGIPRKRPIKG